MSVFADKKYEAMDDLSKLCEPILDPLNDILNLLPDKYDIPTKYILNNALMGHEPHNINIDEIFNSMCDKYNIKLNRWEEKDKIRKCFDLDVEIDENTGGVLNLEEKTLTGVKISIVKIKLVFEEKEVEAEIGAGAIQHLRDVHWRDVESVRMNEILELMGLTDIRRMRSVRQKLSGLREEMRAIMKDNKWHIKDIALSNKIGLWIKLYLEDGNLAALTNFCKIKVMTHEDKPIYSIEEEKV
jgi:hypothetical protein